jgi:hypothetical protein
MIYTKIGSSEHATKVLMRLQHVSAVRWYLFKEPIAGVTYFSKYAGCLIFLGQDGLQYNNDEIRMKRYFNEIKEPVQLVTPNAFIEQVAAACPKEGK